MKDKRQTEIKLNTPQENLQVGRDIGPAVGTENQSQLDRRNAIADAADTARASDMGAVDGADEDRTLPKAEEGGEEDTQITDASDHTKAEANNDENKEDTRTYELIIGGKPKKLTEAEVLMRAQKVEQADEYLRLASESVKNSATAALSTKDETASEEEDFRALAKALQVGTEEEAEQALKDLVTRVTRKLPATDVSQVVDERLTLREEKAKFEQEFEAELKDPYLRSLIISKDSELAEQEPDLSPFQRWRKAGNEVRTWRKGFSPVQSGKAARKAELSAPVKAASGTQRPEADEEGMSDSEYVAYLAKQRGQGRPAA